MTWDTDNNSTFCGTITLSGNGNDSVKKESKTQLLNNSDFCHNVRKHLANKTIAQLVFERTRVYIRSFIVGCQSVVPL